MIWLEQFMNETQRDAAVLPTGQLRAQIQVGVDALTEAIGRFRRLRPGAASEEEMVTAAEDMMGAALAVSLYVRELTTRPPERHLRVFLSCN